MDVSFITRNEDVSDFVIGYFGDERLLKTGALLFKKMFSKMSTCVKKLADNRALQVAFSRFLSNENTTMNEIERSLVDRTNANCHGKEHVLCIQDTVEVNYSKQEEKKATFGINREKKNKGVRGFLAHPGLILDAQNGDVLGLSSVKIWTRGEEELLDKKKRPIEKKESYKWVETAELAKKNITHAKVITIIGDRESDIYELFDRTPDIKTHLIVRAQHNRGLSNGLHIDTHMQKVSSCGNYVIELPAITGKRKSRKAQIEIKYSEIEIKRPAENISKMLNQTIKLTCIEAREIGAASDKEDGVFWRILTTHSVNSFDEAKQIILWYSWRWSIEQIFRTMKKKGLNIEESEIEAPEKLFKLFLLAIAAAVKVLCLVNARNGETKRLARDIFSQDELIVLAAVLVKVNGRTKKQQNPHDKESLSWASWIIARLGGWNGYSCESPPGPITMYDGLDRFSGYLEGWSLAHQKNVCIG